ncbi:MAG: hypothetical protein C4320_00340, partial [Armatimonadota bacterium]
MFDTGFSAWVNVNSNISLGKPTGKTTMVDFVGTSEADTVKIKSLQLGGKPVNCSSNAEAFISGNTDYSSGYNTHCDGLMGFAVIKDNITEINFEKKKFIIYPRSFDITKLPVDNKKKFLVKLSPTGAASMELPVETANGGILTLSLDTGNAFYATTFPESLERVGILKEGFKPKFIKQSGVASGAVDSYSMKMPPLKIFGVPVETSVWDIINLPSALAGFDGTVGFGFLKNFNIVIDYDRRRVHLTNWTGSTADEEEGDVGIGAAHNDRTNRTIVYGVTPDGPADKAGIKRGDFL